MWGLLPILEAAVQQPHCQLSAQGKANRKLPGWTHLEAQGRGERGFHPEVEDLGQGAELQPLHQQLPLVLDGEVHNPIQARACFPQPTRGVFFSLPPQVGQAAGQDLMFSLTLFRFWTS